MKSPLLYLLEVLFCSGLLLGLYRLLLVRRIPYRACRRYLSWASEIRGRQMGIPAVQTFYYCTR